MFLFFWRVLPFVLALAALSAGQCTFATLLLPSSTSVVLAVDDQEVGTLCRQLAAGMQAAARRLR